MRIYKRNPKARSWSIQFTDHTDTQRRLAGCADRDATQELARQIGKLIECRRVGVHPDPALAAWIQTLSPRITVRLADYGLIAESARDAGTGIDAHLAAYATHLRGVAGKRHRIESMGRVRRIVDACTFRRLADIRAERVLRFLVELRDDGAAQDTIRNYRKSILAFVNWAYKTDRMQTDPLKNLDNVTSTKDATPRRALDGGTLRRLIQATMTRDPWRGCSGRERALLYATACSMGIRWDECAKLTRGDFVLDGDRPTLNIRGSVSKNKRRAILPIPLGVARELAAFFADNPALPTAPAFPHRPRGSVGALMMRHDLPAIDEPYLTEEGRADFHALRHSFITNLQKAGVPLAQVRILARHSSVQLTAGRYFHTTAESDALAVASLPAVFDVPMQRTGTDDMPIETTPEKMSPQMSLFDGESRQTMARCGKDTGGISGGVSETKNAGNTVKTSVSRVVEGGAGGGNRTPMTSLEGWSLDTATLSNDKDLQDTGKTVSPQVSLFPPEILRIAEALASLPADKIETIQRIIQG